MTEYDIVVSPYHINGYTTHEPHISTELDDGSWLYVG